MPKTVEQINEKIRKGQAVVVDAEEVIDIVEQKGLAKAAEEVDVVTTGTFGPMCSSGAFINTGHAKPKVKIRKAWLNNVNAYAGLAAVDLYIGATEIPDDDPANGVFPGEFKYGGGHVIHDLVSGKNVRLRATAYGTDCYPGKEIDAQINIKDLNQAFLSSPRNCYQNYNVAVNAHADRPIYTYMGTLLPQFGNANYCSAGQLSPLLKDPFYRTVGIGTRIFLGGGIGYVYWEGTQHNPSVKRNEVGVPVSPAGALSVVGDLKQMDASWLVGTSFRGYGTTLTVGLGIPIPILDEEILAHAAAKDEDLVTQISDYSEDYPNGVSRSLGQVNYKELKSGKITIEGKDVPTAALSSYARAKEIAGILKEWILKGQFLLTAPVAPIPGVGSGQTFGPLKSQDA